MEHANELILFQAFETAPLAIMTCEANGSISPTAGFSLCWIDNHIVTLRSVLRMKLPRLRIPTLHTENLEAVSQETWSSLKRTRGATNNLLAFSCGTKMIIALGDLDGNQNASRLQDIQIIFFKHNLPYLCLCLCLCVSCSWVFQCTYISYYIFNTYIM